MTDRTEEQCANGEDRKSQTVGSQQMEGRGEERRGLETGMSSGKALEVLPS